MKKLIAGMLVLVCCLFGSMPAMGLGVKNTKPPEDCFRCNQKNLPVRRKKLHLSPAILYRLHQQELLNSQAGGRRMVVPTPGATRFNRFRQQQHQSWFEHRLDQQGVDGLKRQHFRERFNDHYGY